MVSISTTIGRLSRMQAPGAASHGTDRLDDLTGFAPDPGNLNARLHIPDDLAAGSALVVALHGCTQTAAGYDHGTGWSTLADREGFAVLFPEQRRANNANMCFNWFEATDIARIGGEAESIVAMVDAVVARHAIDPARVFVTGLSAGGAMAAVMLATWPERFAAGAIIGGLPYGGAIGVRAALERMRGQGLPGAVAAAATVRAAAPGTARRPRVAIWHGSADTTVLAANQDALVDQWRGVHALPAAPTDTDSGRNWTHQMWRDATGAPVVESWRIAGMGHGVPIDPAGGMGAAGPFMLDVGVSSTMEIARSWGLIGQAAERPATAEHIATASAAAKPTPTPTPTPKPTPVAMPQANFERITPMPAADRDAGGTGRVQATIEKALRAAGLMR